MDTEVKQSEMEGREANSLRVSPGVMAPEGMDLKVVEQDSAAPATLRFDRVPWGHSRTLALTINDETGTDRSFEVVTPPLAPFSVVERRPGNRDRCHRATTLWIRYDATSAMASDIGRVVVGDPVAGLTWTVTLEGSGELATS